MAEGARGSRTRVDRGGRNVLFLLVGLVLVVIIGLVVLFLVTRGGATSHATDVVPRNIDIWAVYPDQRLRFATLFFPDDTGQTGPQTVTAAGPLVQSAELIQSTASIGGTELTSEIRPGPGQDSGLVYSLVTIERQSNSEPYGVDVMTVNSPYLGLQPDGSQALALGISQRGALQQVIVAVALPRDAEVTTPADSLVSYRQVNVGDWAVWYFDTTEASTTDAIRLNFTLGGDSPAEIDFRAIDDRR
jgi:hypothetical protein